MFDKITAGFVIRFHYSETDERFNWRYKFFTEKVLPRINNQTYKDFEIYIWCNPAHDKLFIKLGCKVFHAPDVRRYNSNGYYHDFTPYNELSGLPKLDLQIGIDSDDFISRDFVKIIIDAVEFHKKNNPNKSLHICFQPELFNLKTKLHSKMRTYTTNKGSAFMGLFQPDKTNYRFIYSESHIYIIRKADCKKVIPAGHCYAVKHNLNETTGKTIYEIKKNKIVLV